LLSRWPKGRTLDTGESRKCQFCAEIIKKEATVCRYCGRDIADATGRERDKHSAHLYEVRPRKRKRGVDLISDALPFGRLWHGEPDAIENAVDYTKFFSRLEERMMCSGASCDLSCSAR